MDRNTLCHMTAGRFGAYVMSLPFAATVITVGWSLLYDFEGSTATHCHVRNVLPTVSAAIGRRPQCYIWRILLALHCAPRFMYIAAYYGWFTQIDIGKQQPLFQKLVKFTVGLSVVENFMLVVLSSVTSLENRAVHENSFIAFIVSSWMYMLLLLVLLNWYINSYPKRAQPTDLRAYNLMKMYATVNICSFALATYLYIRHNAYCEPYVYSLFAFFEYLTIFTNILFHGAGRLLLRDYSPAVVLTDLINKHR